MFSQDFRHTLLPVFTLEEQVVEVFRAARVISFTLFTVVPFGHMIAPLSKA